jgi:ribonuclease BN (tRNA processing enzyme)
VELIILGSGTGVISLKRGSPGFLLRTEQNLFLTDSGPGTLTRILQSGFELNDIDAIFYTHIHPDHVTDLVPFLFASKYGAQKRKKKLTLVGGPGFKKFFHSLSKTYRGWLVTKSYPLDLREVGESNFTFNDIAIRTCRTNHISESIAIRFENEKGSVVFSGDTDFSENLVVLAKGADVFILECSFPDSMKVKGHLVPRDAARLAKLANPKKLVLTHFYPPCDRVDILKSVRRLYKGKVVLGRDGMRMKV